MYFDTSDCLASSPSPSVHIGRGPGVSRRGDNLSPPTCPTSSQLRRRLTRESEKENTHRPRWEQKDLHKTAVITSTLPNFHIKYLNTHFYYKKIPLSM